MSIQLLRFKFESAHYKDHPEFTFCPTEEDYWEVEASENWVRAATNPRAFLRPMHIKYGATALKKVMCIYFDEMRRFIPVPKLTTTVETTEPLWLHSISADDFEFNILQFLLRRTKQVILDDGLLPSREGRVPIIIFSSSQEKRGVLAELAVNPIVIEEKYEFKLHMNSSLVTDTDRTIISYSKAAMERLETYRRGQS